MGDIPEHGSQQETKTAESRRNLCGKKLYEFSESKGFFNGSLIIQPAKWF